MSPLEILDAFAGVHVLVFGDPMIDVYHFGRSERLSPEAPVPVFIEERTESRPGGAANVAANLEALGCMVTTAFPPKPWTEKHRYMVGHHQLFRHDKDMWYEVPTGIFAERPDVIVISDYDKGACTLHGCQTMIGFAKAVGAIVVVDPKGGGWTRYRGAEVICPNQQEADMGTSEFPYRMLEKRGAEGLRLHNPTGENGWKDLPAAARHVFDVTGAGDTVVAVVAAALGAGADLLSAAKLANIAAGYVVGEVGTAVCPIEKLRELVGA